MAHLDIECASVDFQQLGRHSLVAFRLFQGGYDFGFLHCRVLQFETAVGFRFRLAETEVGCGYCIVRSMEGGEKNHILQLAHVAGERIDLQRFQCRCVKPFPVATGVPGITAQKVFRQWGDVFRHLPQWRNGNVNLTEYIEQVWSEILFRYHFQ